MPTTITLEDAELDTVLAALRTYQEAGYGDPFKRPDRIQDIACPDEDSTSLCDEDIDALCERINFRDAPIADPYLFQERSRFYMEGLIKEALDRFGCISGDCPPDVQNYLDITVTNMGVIAQLMVMGNSRITEDKS